MVENKPLLSAEWISLTMAACCVSHVKTQWTQRNTTFFDLDSLMKRTGRKIMVEIMHQCNENERKEVAMGADGLQWNILGF